MSFNPSGLYGEIGKIGTMLTLLNNASACELKKP
jgi:hypothetical protein